MSEGTPFAPCQFWRRGWARIESDAWRVLSRVYKSVCPHILDDIHERQESMALFSQRYTLNDDGSRGSSSETQLQADGSTVTTDTTWTYDADGRLMGEAATSSVAADSFSDTYTYDLAGNRMSDVHAGPADGASGTITYTYNGDDELASQTSSVSGTTTNTYDANGSLISSTPATGSGLATTYSYDVRNKMVSATVNGLTTTYVYDDAGNRVRETTAYQTDYLTDTQNPTGYAQPIEELQGRQPAMIYFLGDRVIGQSDGYGDINYLLPDGHGSTQMMTDDSGNITATFHYDAFGGAIGFDPTQAGTEYLFGGDGLYDAPSGLYLNGDGTRGRDGYRFIEADTLGNSDNSDPISLHKYLYAGANPVDNYDPSGHDEEVEEVETAALGAEVDANFTLAVRAQALIFRAITFGMRIVQYWPAITAGATVASAVLQAGANYMGQVAQRWSELQGVPTGAFGISRGNFLHQQADSNLGPYFPTIDDFRGGFATSIKTTAVSTPEGLLTNIRGYLSELAGVQNRTLSGSDSNGNPITIAPGDIQAKGLLVAIPAANENFVRDPSFAEEIQNLADEFNTGVRIVAVDAFEE